MLRGLQHHKLHTTTPFTPHLLYPIYKYTDSMNYISFTASAHTGEHGVDEYPDISGITTARVSLSSLLI